MVLSNLPIASIYLDVSHIVSFTRQGPLTKKALCSWLTVTLSAQNHSSVTRFPAPQVASKMISLFLFECGIPLPVVVLLDLQVFSQFTGLFLCPRKAVGLTFEFSNLRRHTVLCRYQSWLSNVRHLVDANLPYWSLQPHAANYCYLY